MTRMVIVMVMDLDKVYEEPDDKEGDGAHDVEKGELLPSPHLAASKTKITWEHNIESAQPFPCICTSRKIYLFSILLVSSIWSFGMKNRQSTVKSKQFLLNILNH